MNDYLNAVETQGLTKRFGGFTAVDAVDFYIPKGEIFGLLGPNGAGKTTTIRMLCGIMRQTEGQAKVLGYDIAAEPEQIKRRIGYMSQRFSLYNDLTARENIQFYASVYGVEPDARVNRVNEMIAMAGLEEHAKERTRNLSGAWRQRLALACAIAHRPPMLFLDEATAGVDPVSRRSFWDLIYQMAGEGVSVLATTHYMDEAEYCNTIGMMYRGKLIAVASPDTLRDELPGVVLQVDCDRLEDAERMLDQTSGVIDAAVHGTQLHVVVESEALMRRIERSLTRAGFTLRSIELISPSLEDVFISMVEQSRSSLETGED